MKRKLVTIALFIIATTALIFLLWQGDGYLLIAFGTKTIEMTLWVAAMMAVALYILLWLLRKVLASGAEMVRRFREIFLFGSVERAQKRAANGMVDYLTGDWVEARKKLIRTLAKVEYPLANYIAAARSSYEMGDEDEAKKILDMARKIANSELPIALTEARLHVQAGRYEEALTILKPIEIKMPRQAAVLDLMHHIYMAQKNWRALEELLPSMRKAKVLSVSEMEALELLLASEKIRDLSQKTQTLLIAERLPALQTLWKSFSRSLQKMPELIQVYAQALIENYQDQEAEVIVRKALGNQWYAPLVNLYGRLQVKEIHSQIRTTEGWLRTRPQDAELLLAHGRLMLRNQQWELAREYFQRSLQQQQSLEATVELARLMDKLGDHKKSADYYQQSLVLVGHNPA